jgi:predicted enzyme related to lactoylglutathione lyase
LDRTIVHFEIPANDVEKLSGFYSKVFGWKFEKVETPDGNAYWLITTKDKQESAGVNGGMVKKMDANQRPTNYVQVESIDDYLRKIEQHGGKTIMPRTVIPKMVIFALAVDPEGNPLGLVEPTMPQ